MSFRNVFIAVTISTALVLVAFLINSNRPPADTERAGPEFIRATGKCASCHLKETSAVVHQYETSRHAREGVTCLDCHRVVEGQQAWDHSGFTITQTMTAKNCGQCHTTEVEQFKRSRHGAPAWAAVAGAKDFTPEQVAHAEKFHPGTVLRPPNRLAIAEGAGVLQKGCLGCHSVGKPNADGSIGTCTACHSRHNASVALARSPQTCGQCHMGPDHSQIEIYNESKHGVLFAMQRHHMNLAADPKSLTTRDMPVPTCATCHMSGLEGQNVTHDTIERLSWWLFAPISKKRPHYDQAQIAMKETCLKCHAKTSVEQFYSEAEVIVASTNDKVQVAINLMKALREEGLLTPEPFDERIEFIAFDLWHYYGRTAKHGAFMGGADFVQWHGNYELLLKMTELKKMAEEIRAQNEAQ